MNAPQKLELLSQETLPTLAAVEEAANWHVRLHTAETNEADRAAFELWYRQHPANAEAYKRMEALWGQFEGIEKKPAIAALESALQCKPPNKREQLRIKSITLGLAFLVVGWLAMKTEIAGYLMSDYNTAVGEQRVVELADHSRITLNTYSAIDVEFDGHQRHITLHKGEILVEVAKDAARPFIVETSQGTARALGTRFVVKRENNMTTVDVVESVVEACKAASYFSNVEKQCVRLRSGQGTQIGADAIQSPMPVDVETAAGWADGVFAVDNQPLTEVLNELARYRRGHIYFNTSEIADLRVSGVFPLTNPDRALEILAGTLPIEVEHYTPLLVVVRSR